MSERPDPNGLLPCMIHIDKEGRWYHEGVEIIRRDYIQDFFRNMTLDAQGHYVITWQGRRCYVDVADTAHVIWNVVFQAGPGSGNDGFTLSVSDDSKEDLAPETLHVGKDHVLYCRIRNATFPARFSRAAYYTLAAHIEEKDGVFYLPVNGKKYEIK